MSRRANAFDTEEDRSQRVRSTLIPWEVIIIHFFFLKEKYTFINK